MKKSIIQLFLLTFVLVTVSSYNLFSQDIKYTKIRKAEGTFNWKLEDTSGNIVKEGSVVDGEWRQSGGLLIDYLILELSEDKKIETDLILLGEKRCPMLEMNMQVYFNGEFYPGKKYRERYVIQPVDWDDTGTRFGMGNKQTMLFGIGGATCLYRTMMGCFVNRIVIYEETAIKIEIEDKYVFYILGGTDYKWTR